MKKETLGSFELYINQPFFPPETHLNRSNTCLHAGKKVNEDFCSSNFPLTIDYLVKRPRCKNDPNKSSQRNQCVLTVLYVL